VLVRLRAVTSNLVKKVLLTNGGLTDGDTLAVRVMTSGLNHVVASRVDGHVVDIAGAGAVEDEITRLLLIIIKNLRSLTELSGSTVIDRLAATLEDTILAQTRAVETNNTTIITIRGDLHVNTPGCTLIVTTTITVWILVDHGTDSRDDLVRTGESESKKSKKSNNETHYFEQKEQP